MNAAAKLGAMIASIVGAGALGLPIPGEHRRHGRNKVARRKAVTYTQKLREKFAANAIERYGLGVVTRGSDGDVKTILTGGMDRAHRRRMRNARKLQRQTPLVFGTRPSVALKPCARFWSLTTHAARRKHMRGARGCARCIAFIKAEAKARGLR